MLEKGENAVMLSVFLVRQMTLQTGGFERGGEGQQREGGGRQREREVDKKRIRVREG